MKISILIICFIFAENSILDAQELIVEKTKTVLAVGVGKNRNEAVKDALRNSVEQAVGVYLKTESITKNYQMISDSYIFAQRQL